VFNAGILAFLLRAIKPGWDIFHKLEADGKSYPEAIDLALESVIPKDGREFADHPPEPLSLDDQEKVYRKLERRQELLSELGSKRPTRRKPRLAQRRSIALVLL
jgi:hypothetical protein